MPEHVSYYLQRVADMLRLWALTDDRRAKAHFAFLAEEYGEMAGLAKARAERERKPS